MNKQEIKTKLYEILEDIKDESNFDENAPLISDGILDSLELINYLTQIEEEFGFEVPMEDLEEKHLGIIVNMVEYLANKL